MTAYQNPKIHWEKCSSTTFHEPLLYLSFTKGHSQDSGSYSLFLLRALLSQERERLNTLSLRRRRAVESEKEETRTKYILCIFGGRRLGARRFLPFFHARTHRPVVVIENYTVSCPNLALTHRSGRALAHAHTHTRTKAGTKDERKDEAEKQTSRAVAAVLCSPLCVWL